MAKIRRTKSENVKKKVLIIRVEDSMDNRKATEKPEELE